MEEADEAAALRGGTEAFVENHFGLCVGQRGTEARRLCAQPMKRCNQLGHASRNQTSEKHEAGLVRALAPHMRDATCTNARKPPIVDLSRSHGVVVLIASPAMSIPEEQASDLVHW